MIATLSFTLPEEQAEYHDAVNGWRYRIAIQDALNHLKLLADSGHENADNDRMLLISCCNDNDFDPWEDR